MKKKDKKNPNNLKNFGWSNIYLNRILKKEVEIGGYGTQRYVIKNGKNKGKVL
tara:strand:+ start:415 stop:573 length:159 start_codon:yes stop_codon:yes gene_type:complete